jgi:hypothetical protein
METQDLPSDPNPASGIFADIRQLSSGTMATISGLNGYVEIEELRLKFMQFYLSNYDPKWKTWVCVWLAWNRNAQLTRS